MNPFRFFQRRREDAALNEEIAAHIESERAENLARGMSPEEADRQARVKFGSARRVHEDVWQHNSVAWLEDTLRDLRYALRSLAHAPGFALTVILVIALGVGANTAVFSVMNAVLLKSLPVADPARIFYLNTSGMPDGGNNTGEWTTSFSYPVLDAFRRQARAFSDVMAYIPLSNTGKVAVRIGNSPEEAEGNMVGGNYLSGLGVPIARGRGFTAQDEATHASIAVISYDYWQHRFSGSPAVLGSTIFVKGVPLTIVGVTAHGFQGTISGDSVDFWIPLQSRPELNAWGDTGVDRSVYQRPNWWCIRMLARLAPGISQKQAVAQTQPLFSHAAYIGIGHPRAGEKPPQLSLVAAKAFPGYDESYGAPLKMMMAMVTLVLLIALSNIVMLLVARSANRQREFSVRLSLGATRGRLLRQLFAESALLVVAGGFLAWPLAGVATRALGRWAHIDASLSPDAVTLAFTLAILVAAALLFGLAPLRPALAGGLGLAIKSSSAVTNQGPSRSRVFRLIAIGQMAVCLALLVGAGLLVRTLQNLKNTSLGFLSEGLVVFGVNPQHNSTPNEGFAFYQLLLSRLRALPGVESVSLAENRPGSGWSSNNGGFLIDGHQPPNSDGEQGQVRMNNVGANFFHTLSVPVLAGRDFTDADTSTSPKVAIVNQTFAQRFLPGQSPVGHILGGASSKETAQIVGVVKDHKYTSTTEEPRPMLWLPYTQRRAVGELHVEMRVATGDPLAILPAAQEAVRRIDPDLPLLEPILQSDQFDRSISQQSLFARLAGCFGLLAVILVATGIYGTLAYQVGRRTPEIGVRMALGAQRSQVVWMVLRASLLVTAFGLLVGAPLAAAISRELAAALYNVKPYDGLTYAAAIAGLVAIALAASALPAWRASRLDPARALRTE